MTNLDQFAIWLATVLANDSFAYSGGDNDDVDTDSDADDSGAEDDDEDDDGSSGDADGDDDDGDDDSDSDDEDVAKQLRDAKKELRKTQRDLNEALDMLEEQESRGYDDSDDDEPSAEVVRLREENDAMRALLNGPFIQAQIDGFKTKTGEKRWDWEDAETVFALLDRSELEVDPETGVIDGLEEQLEDLAKHKPFLLKSKTRKTSGNGASGRAPRNSAGGEKKLSKDDFAKDFSVFSTLG